MLFALPAMGLHEQRAERRRTIKERCERMAALAAGPDPALAWCHLNAEGALLRDLIPGAIEVSGAMPDEAKEEAFAAFTSGQTRVLITKPKIGAWGLNFQHCAHVLTFPSHSYEQLYQGVRRCWRFGQTRPVVVDTILTEGDGEVLKSVRRKAAAADRMFTRLVAQMGDALRIERGAVYPHREEVPTWLS
jgi:hypothetical protein